MDVPTAMAAAAVIAVIVSIVSTTACRMASLSIISSAVFRQQLLTVHPTHRAGAWAAVRRGWPLAVRQIPSDPIVGPLGP